MLLFTVFCAIIKVLVRLGNSHGIDNIRGRKTAERINRRTFDESMSLIRACARKDIRCFHLFVLNLNKNSTLKNQWKLGGQNA
jgi:hypothetical protein